jgi:hypothetical protein
VDSLEELESLKKRMVQEADDDCLNKMKHFARCGPRGKISEEGRRNLIRGQNEARERRNVELEKFKGKKFFYTGTTKAEFTNFDDFYTFIQTIERPLKGKKVLLFKNMNWESESVKSRFREILESKVAIGQKKLKNAFSNGLEDVPSTIAFWTDRGWSEDEAKQKVSDVQSKCGNKFAEKVRNGTSIRLSPMQVEY